MNEPPSNTQPDRRAAGTGTRRTAIESPHTWNDWYRFAAEELSLEHDERVDYANHRFIEEQNRDRLRRVGPPDRRRD